MSSIVNRIIGKGKLLIISRIKTRKRYSFRLAVQRTPHDLDLSILYDFHMAFSSSIHGQRIDITFSQHIDIPSDEIDILALGSCQVMS